MIPSLGNSKYNTKGIASFLLWLTEGLRIAATTAMSVYILNAILTVHESTMNSIDTGDVEVLSLKC